MAEQKRSEPETELVATARRVLPGGGFGNVPHEIVIAEGRGSHVWDVSGNEYVDYLLGSGPMIVGHAHPEVVEVIQQVASKGTTFFANNPYGIRLAAEIVDAVPCAEKVRFVSSGSEADAYALRLARAYKKRDKILKFEGGYHGMSDYGLARLAGGLLAQAACVAPLQREVLPQQQAVAVGRGVQLGPGHVGVHAQQVEPGLLGEDDVALELVGRRLGRAACGRRPWFVPLRNKRSPFTVMIQRFMRIWRSPVRTERRWLGSPARRHVDGHVVQRLVAERVGPPQRRPFDGDLPADLVLTGGERLLQLECSVPCRPSSRVAVVAAAASSRRGPAAPPAPADASGHRTRRRLMRTGPVSLEADGSPDAARVPVRVEAVPVLEHAGDVALGRAVGLRAAGDLDPSTCSERSRRASVTSKGWGKK